MPKNHNSLSLVVERKIVILKDYIKYFTKKALIKANNAAIRENRNRQLKETFLDALLEGHLFPASIALYHSKDELRLAITFSETQIGYLDMSKRRYNALPDAIIQEDGTIDFQCNDVIAPYPTEREWTEKTTLKPYRDPKFRKNILKAYNNKCAVCSISDVSLLRAAHIISAVKSGNDSNNNGICLCVLHEIAFDRGIMKITPSGDIIVDTTEDIKIELKKIRYPNNPEDHPSTENLRWHFESRNMTRKKQ